MDNFRRGVATILLFSFTRKRFLLFWKVEEMIFYYFYSWSMLEHVEMQRFPWIIPLFEAIMKMLDCMYQWRTTCQFLYLKARIMVRVLVIVLSTFGGISHGRKLCL